MLEATQSRTFNPGKNGHYRGALSWLKKVKRMYNTAKLKTRMNYMGQRRFVEMKEGAMKISITQGESLFPYTETQMMEMKTKIGVA